MNLNRLRVLSLGALFSVITCLLTDEAWIRYTAAALLAGGAVPWWATVHIFFRRQAFNDLVAEIVPPQARQDSHECAHEAPDHRSA